jgi:TIR domain
MVHGAPAADIFISHASADKPLVGAVLTQLRAALKALGADYTDFTDRPEEISTARPSSHSIHPNELWRDVLAHQLGGCACTIVFWSKTALASDWVKTESEISYDDDKKLFQVTLDADGAAYWADTPMFRQHQAVQLHKFPSCLDVQHDGRRDSVIADLAARIHAHVPVWRAARRAERGTLPREIVP